MALQLLHPNTAIIPADIDYLEEVRDYFTHFLHKYALGPSEVMAWELAFTEVVSNAIVHGSNPKLKDEVLISWQKYANLITLSVTDNGPGPEAELTQNPSLPRDPLATSGRGLYIISKFADRWQHVKSRGYYTQVITKQYSVEGVEPSTA